MLVYDHFSIVPQAGDPASVGRIRLPMLQSWHQDDADARHPRGLLTESALVWIISGKYQYGMSLFRQAALLHRFGGNISSNTITASVVRVD